MQKCERKTAMSAEWLSLDKKRDLLKRYSRPTFIDSKLWPSLVATSPALLVVLGKSRKSPVRVHTNIAKFGELVHERVLRTTSTITVILSLQAIMPNLKATSSSIKYQILEETGQHRKNIKMNLDHCHLQATSNT